jgi:hypothetical protein
MRDVDAIWRNIERHAGEVFTQIQGGTFTYTLRGNSLVLDRTNQAISRTQLEEAVRLLPFTDTTSLQHLRAPSYLFAILTDARIVDPLTIHKRQSRPRYTKSETLSRDIWARLIDLAAVRQTITYRDLGERYGIRGQALQNFARILAPIKYYCIDQHLPPLSALVVYSHSSVPGSGVEADEMDIDRVFAYDWKNRRPLIPTEGEFAAIMQKYKVAE